MKHLHALAVLVLLAGLYGCGEEKQVDPDPDPEKEIVYGRNDYTMTHDGIEREYIVHVPQSYDGTTAVPVVLMLHGTSGDGEKMFNITGWKEVGEDENILTVYPSSLRYCIIDEGERKNTTKWNSQPVEWQFCENETPADDIGFLRAVIDSVVDAYNVDESRIYLVGFSNGGQMAALCAVKMGDRLAAVVESAGSLYVDSAYGAVRNLPVTFQIGNKDYGPGVDGEEISLSLLEKAITTPENRLYKIASAHRKTFSLDTTYTIGGDTNTVSWARYLPIGGDPTNEFNVVFIKGLGHAYPNGTNHWLQGARVNWEWLKKYSNP